VWPMAVAVRRERSAVGISGRFSFDYTTASGADGIADVPWNVCPQPLHALRGGNGLNLGHDGL